MPELPEVETIKRQLAPVLVKQTINSIDIFKNNSFQGSVEDIIGSTVVSVGRKGKMLIIATKNGKQTTSFILIHLKMTGQLIYESLVVSPRFSVKQKTDNSKLITDNRIIGGHPTNSWTNTLPDKHTRVAVNLDKGTLFFNDQRMFGWVRVVDSESVNQLIGKMPPDIIDSQLTSKFFYSVLQSSGQPVKVVVMDSSKLGGVGNIYANDGLFLAGIDPKRPAKSLSCDESDRLLEALQHVVNLGIELGGATAGDGKFVNTTGVGGKYQDHFLVYEQEGQVRERNGKKGVVNKFKLAGRGTYWVPELQN